ncbi:MAG: helix-turn-helix transcriptional regulator [Lachnospiraceae bacterium]|nr:helix-turn-helix transcriptional regulator [Lachnospiraceae bacterium]
MCVGMKIKDYLDTNGISQTHVSNETQIPLPKLNLALNGKRRLTFEEYELICGAVNVGTDKFLEPRKAGTVSSDGR